jgi:hypothetical protein
MRSPLPTLSAVIAAAITSSPYAQTAAPAPTPGSSDGGGGSGRFWSLLSLEQRRGTSSCAAAPSPLVRLTSAMTVWPAQPSR